MNKRALLTGIGGSIGCHVFAHIMHNTEWDVVGIDSFRDKGLYDRVEHMFIEHPEWRKRLQLHVHDLRSPITDMLHERMGPIDYIVNLASLSDVHDSINNPVPFIETNVRIILNMLEYASSLPGLGAFLQVSTDEVYGPTDGSYVHPEWSPIVPSNPYSASKAAQEAIAISYWRTYNVPLIIVNIMNNFGEMQSPAKFPAIVQRKIFAGEPITVHGAPGKSGSRVYIHSRNTADALLFLLRGTLPHLHKEGTADRPDRYNIVGDRQVSNVELIKLIAGEMNLPYGYNFADASKSRPGHDLHYGLDGTKLADLGWRSPRSFEESLRGTVEWQMKHPEWLEPSR